MPITLNNIPRINTRRAQNTSTNLDDKEKKGIIIAFIGGAKTADLSRQYGVSNTVVQKLVAPFRPTSKQVLDIMKANYEASLKND